MLGPVPQGLDPGRGAELRTGNSVAVDSRVLRGQRGLQHGSGLGPARRTGGGRPGGRGHPPAWCVRSSRAWLASEAAMLAISWARAGGARVSRLASDRAAPASAASRAARVAAGPEPAAVVVRAADGVVPGLAP